MTWKTQKRRVKFTVEIKTPTKFETFNNGVCDLYTVSEGKITTKRASFYYGNRVIGIKRFFAAKAVTVEINKLIQIPRYEDISSMDAVVIDSERYKIEQIQHISDTNPPITVLTLRQIGAVK